MADDIDIAQERETGLRDAALSAHQSRMQYESKRLAELEERGEMIRCLYCDEPLVGFTSRFCDHECKEEYDIEQEAINSGRVVKVRR